MALLIRHFHNNLTAGELTPVLQGRADLTAHKNGARIMFNYLARPQGGAKRRPGSVFVARAKYNDRLCRLIPFKFSVTQNYILEVGHEYMRFFSHRGRLEETFHDVVGAEDNGSGAIRMEVTAHGYSTGNHVAVRAVRGTTEANEDWRITVIDADHFDLDGSSFTNDYVSHGRVSRIIEISSPWTEDQLEELNYAQDADLMFFVHPDRWPWMLKRTSPTTFTLNGVNNVANADNVRWINGPFSPINIDEDHTMTWSGATAKGTNAVMTSSKPYFHADMAGMYFRFAGRQADEQGVLRITSVSSTTQASMTVVSALSSATETDDWALGAWGAFSGFPRTVTFFEQRLIFGGNRANPQTIWGSSIGRYFDHSVGTADDDAFVGTVAAEDVNVIQWLAAHDALLIGTQGGEYVAVGSSNTAITPTNALIRQQSSFGGEYVRPVKIGNSILYIQRGGRRVRDMNFNLEQDRYLTDDLTLLSEHIFQHFPIAEGTFQLSPDPVAWFVREDGLLTAMTIIKSQEVISWSRHQITDTMVLSASVIPETASSNDDVWISGLVDTHTGQKVYIGYLDEHMPCDWGLEAVFDSPVMEVFGLDHLEGRTVVINGDGAVYPTVQIEGGRFSLQAPQAPITHLRIGLPFIPVLIPMSPELQLPNGPSFGAKKRYAKVKVFTVDTMTITVNGETAAARSPGDLMDTAPEADVLGIFQFTTLGSEEIVSLILTQPLPLETDITSIYGEVEVE